MDILRFAALWLAGGFVLHFLTWNMADWTAGVVIILWTILILTLGVLTRK